MTLGGQHPLTQFADASDGGAVQLRCLPMAAVETPDMIARMRMVRASTIPDTRLQFAASGRSN
jgi:hypothetical protein